MGRYNDFISKLVDSPELALAMWAEIPGRMAEADETSKEQAAVYAHLLVAYGIIEEAFSLYSKKWIDEENWSQWAEWLRILSKHPSFARVAKAASGTFDTKFEEYVLKEILNEKDVKERKE